MTSYQIQPEPGPDHDRGPEPREASPDPDATGFVESDERVRASDLDATERTDAAIDAVRDEGSSRLTQVLGATPRRVMR